MTQAKPDEVARPEATGPYTVTAYQHANVRSEPDTGGAILSFVEANQSYGANCWTVGEPISDNGITNNVWIQLPLNAGGVGYVSAVYLKGNKTAGLPDSAQC